MAHQIIHEDINNTNALPLIPQEKSTILM